MSETNLADGKLLTSWKEIAAFLGKGVRTVQRWETTLGLPIIRPEGALRNVVLARCEDLEAWVQKGRTSQPQPDTWLKKDEEAKLRLGAGLKELRRTVKEIKGLVQDVAISRAMLREEVRRFQSLHQEWKTIRNRDAEAGDTPLHLDVDKVNCSKQDRCLTPDS